MSETVFGLVLLLFELLLCSLNCTQRAVDCKLLRVLPILLIVRFPAALFLSIVSRV